MVQQRDQPHDRRTQESCREAGQPTVQQATADPLQNYCPDLDQWSGSWAYEPRDIPPGLRMVECFKPFLRELLALSMSRKTLRLQPPAGSGCGGEDHPPTTDGQRSPQAAGQSGRPRPHWRRRRAATLPWPVRSRATLIRCNLPQALSLPDSPRDHHDDEPIASLTAPMRRGHAVHEAPQPASGAPQAQGLTAIAMAEAKLAVPSGEAPPTKTSATSSQPTVAAHVRL